MKGLIMFKRMTLSGKLISGFVAVAAIATGIGIVGMVGMRTAKGHVLDVGNCKLPGIQNLLTIAANLEKIKVAALVQTEQGFEGGDDPHRLLLRQMGRSVPDRQSGDRRRASRHARFAQAVPRHGQTGQGPCEGRQHAAVIGVVSAVTLGVFLAISITRPVNRIIAGLAEGAEQVAAASQSLAEGATEQAAGLQETSSSLEEMSSMTQQNAANAEESAGASEELSAQAESMQEIVGQLVAMVGGAGSERPRGKNTSTDNRHARGSIEHGFHSVTKPKSSSRTFGKSDEVLHKIASSDKAHRAASRSATKSIPLDSIDESLSEFNN
jgi:hypothetical protein